MKKREKTRLNKKETKKISKEVIKVEVEPVIENKIEETPLVEENREVVFETTIFLDTYFSKEKKKKKTDELVEL